MVEEDNDRAPVVRLGAGRSLKTAAEVLAALRILGTASAGLTADTLARELGKSPATGRYLLNTLVQEGYATKGGAAGQHVLATGPPWGRSWGTATPDARYELPGLLSDAVTELFSRTRQRTYLARWEDDATVIVDARGHQGLARIPDLAERIPLAQAHALAVTKALVATSAELAEMCLAHPDRAAFTGTTITRTPELELELARVRRTGVAVDREEFAEGFCCIGAPIMAPDGRVAASIAISTPARRFALEAEELTSAVREVAVAATRCWRDSEPDDEPVVGRPETGGR